MGALPDSARDVLESDALAHLVTVNRDGSPQVSVVWVGLDGDDIVSGHLFEQQKLRNVRRDPRVALTLEAQVTNPLGCASTSSSTAAPRSRTAVLRSSCRSSPAPISAPASSSRACPLRRRASGFA